MAKGAKKKSKKSAKGSDTEDGSNAASASLDVSVSVKSKGKKGSKKASAKGKKGSKKGGKKGGKKGSKKGGKKKGSKKGSDDEDEDEDGDEDDEDEDDEDEDEEGGAKDKDEVSYTTWLKSRGKTKTSRKRGDYDKGGRADYQVMCHVIEARDLAGKDKNHMSDPLVKVSCFGKEEKTGKKKKTVNATWDEILHFTDKLTDEDFETQTISLEVFDCNTIKRNTVIGKFSIDIAYIYARKNHELRSWVALSQPAAIEGVQGYLKVDIVVLGPGDAPPATMGKADADEDPQNVDDLQAAVLMPPQIKMEPHQLIINVHRAEKLPKFDKLGKIDAYVKVKFGTEICKTKHIKSDFNPSWDTALNIPVALPCLSENIEVSIWDHDTAGSDEFLTAFNLSFSKIKDENLKPTWYVLYGHPDQQGALAFVTNRIKNKKKQQHKFATLYFGRVLLSARLEKAAKPTNSNSVIAKVPNPPTTSIFVWVDVYEMIELNTTSSVRCQIVLANDDHVASKKVKVKNRRAEMYEGLAEVKIEVPVEKVSWPDLFIIIQSKNTIGYSDIGMIRYHISDLVTAGKKDKPEWVVVEPMQNESKNKGHHIAHALLKVQASTEAKRYKMGNRTNLKRPEMIKHVLRCHVYQGRHIRSEDAENFPDPLIEISCGNHKVELQKKDNTSFPKWYETATLHVDVPEDRTLAPLVYFRILDHDTISQNDYMGSFFVPMEKFGKKFQKTPKWYDVKVDSHHEIRGQLLCSFQLIPEHEGADIPPPKDITPTMKKAELEVFILGCRGVASPNFLPLKKPLVEIDAGDRETQQSTAPSKNPSTTNPNYLQMLNFKLELPTQALYAPYLYIKVKDTRVGSALCGMTELPLAKIVPFIEGEDPYAEGKEELSESDKDTKKPFDFSEEEEGGESKQDKASSDFSRDDKSFVKDTEDSGAEGGSDASGSAPTKEYSDLHWSEMEPTAARSPSVKRVTKAAKQRLKDQEKTIKELKKKVTMLQSQLTQAEGGMSGEDTREGDESEDESRPVDSDGNPKRTMPEVSDKPLKDIGTESTESDSKPVRDHEYSDFDKVLDDSLLTNYKLVLGNAKKECGILKACVRYKGKDRTDDEKIDLVKKFKPTELVVRLYMLRGESLVPKDLNGSSDPYIIVKYGGKELLNDRDERKDKTLRPEFLKCFEFPVTLPGEASVEIIVMDWDRGSKDDVIGSTKIDLEQRWFSEKWQSYELKPIEHRALWHSSSRGQQGKLEMWVDIMTPEDAALNPQESLEEEKPAEWELRVIVWNTKNVRLNSKDGKQVDIAVSGTVEGADAQSTDTHWRSLNGEGMFNWRMKFPVMIPGGRFDRLKLAIWDREITHPNDAIAEANLNLAAMFRKAHKRNAMVEVPKQWVSLYHPRNPGVQGKVEITLQVMTVEEAANYPAGFGRKEPNKNPILPEPNRPPTSFAPWQINKRIKDFFFRKRFLIIGIVFAVIVLIILIIIAWVYANKSSSS